MLIYIIKRGALTNNSWLKAILSDWEPNIVMVYFSFRRPAVVYIGSIGNKSVLTLLEPVSYTHLTLPTIYSV